MSFNIRAVAEERDDHLIDDDISKMFTSPRVADLFDAITQTARGEHEKESQSGWMCFLLNIRQRSDFVSIPRPDYVVLRVESLNCSGIELVGRSQVAPIAHDPVPIVIDE